MIVIIVIKKTRSEELICREDEDLLDHQNDFLLDAVLAHPLLVDNRFHAGLAVHDKEATHDDRIIHREEVMILDDHVLENAIISKEIHHHEGEEEILDNIQDHPLVDVPLADDHRLAVRHHVDIGKSQKDIKTKKMFEYF